MITNKFGFALVVCFWLLVITAYVLSRVRARRQANNDAIERQAIVERLLRPNWEFYERHLQRPAPPALRDLYGDRRLVTMVGLKYGKKYDISTFNPIDQDWLLDTRDTIGFDIVAFANSDCGDPIYLRPGSSESDAVYISHHDKRSHIAIFADSVGAMVEKLRDANRAA